MRGQNLAHAITTFQSYKKTLPEISSKIQYISRFLEYGSIRNFKYNDKNPPPRIFPYFGLCIETLFSVFTYILRIVSDNLVNFDLQKCSFVQLRPANKVIIG